MILSILLLVFSLEGLASSLPNSCQIYEAYQVQGSEANFSERLKQECQLMKKFKKIEANYQSLGLNLTQLAEYQVMRYTQRSWFEQARDKNVPIEKIYQPLKLDYLKPISERSTLIWDSWTQAIENLPPWVEQLKAGHPLNLNSILQIHRNFYSFYPLFSEQGDFSHYPYPGILKPTLNSLESAKWWEEEGSDNFKNKKLFIDHLQAYYLSLGVVTNLKGSYPNFINRVLDVRAAPDNNSKFFVYSGHSMTHRQNLELLIKFINQYFAQWIHFKANANFEQIKIKMTPAEFAFFVQQYFVRLHPFYEGNGRTSRALQELILLSFELPHGSSGDLMDIDVFTKDDEYYKQGLTVTSQLLDRAQQCLSQIILSQKISYNCQLLESRQLQWQHLHQKNQSLEGYLNAISQLDRNRQLSDDLHNQALRMR